VRTEPDPAAGARRRAGSHRRARPEFFPWPDGRGRSRRHRSTGSGHGRRGRRPSVAPRAVAVRYGCRRAVRARRPAEPPLMPVFSFICRTCGVQYAPTPEPPASCPICLDERQYVGWQGQRWTTLEELATEGRTNEVSELEPGLYHVGTKPPIAIGQRAL